MNGPIPVPVAYPLRIIVNQRSGACSGCEWNPAVCEHCQRGVGNELEEAQPAAPAGEWPKWTSDITQTCIRVWPDNQRSFLVFRDAGIAGRWAASANLMTLDAYESAEKAFRIPRAQAVALIGEQAVAEGERLARGGAK